MDLTLFLHHRGYNFFTIPKLTFGEIDALMGAWNREQIEKEKAAKKSSRKYKK